MIIQPVLSLSGTAVASGTPIQLNAPACQLYASMTGIGVISAGTALLEESDDPTYTGTWSLVSTVDLTALSGGAKVVLVRNATCMFARWRTTVAVTGGGSFEGRIGG